MTTSIVIKIFTVAVILSSCAVGLPVSDETPTFARQRRMGQPITTCGDNLITACVKAVTFAVTTEQGCPVDKTFDDSEAFTEGDVLTTLQLAYNQNAEDNIQYTVEITYSVPDYQSAAARNTDGTNPPIIYIGGCNGYSCAYCTGLYEDNNSGLMIVPDTNGTEWKEVLTSQGLGPVEYTACSDENGQIILPCTFERSHFVVSDVEAFEANDMKGTSNVSYNDTIASPASFPDVCQ